MRHNKNIAYQAEYLCTQPRLISFLTAVNRSDRNISTRDRLTWRNIHRITNIHRNLYAH